MSNHINMRGLPPLEEGTRLFCRKPLRINSRTYSPGQEFLYKKMAISWRRVLLLYSQKVLVRKNFFSKKEWKDILAKNPATKEGAKIEARHHAGGWYDILIGGKKHGSRRYRKDAAEAKIQKLRKQPA